MSELGIQWKILLAQTISFSIVLFFLWRFAYRPIFAMLEARRKKSPKASPTPKKSRRNSRSTEAERKRVLAQAGDLAEPND